MEVKATGPDFMVPSPVGGQVRGPVSEPELRYSADMPANTSRLTSIVEEYLGDLRRVRASGGATAERSTYATLAVLFDSIGATLRPKVVCVPELAGPGRGSPRLRPLRYRAGPARDTAPGPGPLSAAWWRRSRRATTHG